MSDYLTRAEALEMLDAVHQMFVRTVETLHHAKTGDERSKQIALGKAQNAADHAWKMSLKLSRPRSHGSPKE